MAVYTLFQGNTHNLDTSNDNGAFTLGVQFSVSQSAALTGVWFYSGPDLTGSTLPTDTAIYDIATTSIVSGTHQSSVTWSGAALSGWVKSTYNGSVTLQPGHNYVAVVYSPPQSVTWFDDAYGYWTLYAGSSGITNGPLSAPSSASAVNGQAVYDGSGSLAFPASTVQGYDFGVDVEVTINGGINLFMVQFP